MSNRTASIVEGRANEPTADRHWRHSSNAVMIVACVLLSSLMTVVAPASGQPQLPRFERGGTFPVTLEAGQNVETGTLVVAEDRSRPEGRILRLPVAILRTAAASPAADPVLYVPGGPGGTAVNTARYGWAYPFLAHRDLIIVEPRGGRFAEPALLCADVPTARVAEATGGEGAHVEVDAARSCRVALSAAGVDAAAYTTAASAEDLEDLRKVLGYAQWNLYGVSYGTRVGLELLRRFPGSVRTAVFDSVLPPTVRYDDRSRANRARAFDLLFRDCKADPGCRAAYPRLQARWSAALASATSRPWRIAAKAAPDGPSQTVILTGQALAEVIPLGDTDALPDLPALLWALADRDKAALARVGNWALRPSSYAWGVRYSIWCAEEAPSARRDTRKKGRPLVSEAVCKVWAVPAADAAAQRPVRSDVPVLLLSGEYDPETPPAWADEAARTLPYAQTITFRGMAHAVTQTWSQPCAMSLANAFLRDPARPLDQTCARALGAPAFKLAR